MVLMLKKFGSVIEIHKWSEKMEKLFNDMSQKWTIDVSNDIKKMISDTVVKNGYKTMTKTR